MQYSIKGLADLAGITTRTLRYYDEIGLLKPAEIKSNGYRYYDQKNVYTLQQILFYKELDVPLTDIQRIISQKEFDLIKALESHSIALQRKVNRYQQLLNTVENTIHNLKGKIIMENDAYFEGFDERQYAEEAELRWGETMSYKESMQNWSSYSDEQKEVIKMKSKDLAIRMVSENQDVKPDDMDVQKAVGEYLAHINEYFYTCDAASLVTLSEMWVEDPRFAQNYNRIREGGAEFVREAVRIFYQQNKEE
ncbi:MAG: MerR family transcriptional regulator [Anaerolineaceae bacterium]|nr:MerR family transcriptional regulator [Anaerolineaceae bacterium]